MQIRGYLRVSALRVALSTFLFLFLGFILNVLVIRICIEKSFRKLPMIEMIRGSRVQGASYQFRKNHFVTLFLLYYVSVFAQQLVNIHAGLQIVL